MQPTGGNLEKDASFVEVMLVTFMVGLVGAIFIAGTFIYQEIEMDKRLNQAYYQIQNIK